MAVAQRRGQVGPEAGRPGSDRVRSRNEVLLCGRVSAAPVERELASGDTIMTTRVVVERGPGSPTRSAPRFDTIDCVAWAARVQRSMRVWLPGDLVRVEGSVRRRFFRAGGGAVSRVEVEVLAARRLRRSGDPKVP